ncbi:hypothetical protein, partial [Pseudomonas sp. A-1]|uniref:hypothetical protein n=1 Tax=Pseudomonas sp. A-1 TaxID=1821274 RepID=UPI001C4988E0
ESTACASAKNSTTEAREMNHTATRAAVNTSEQPAFNPKAEGRRRSRETALHLHHQPDSST